MPKSSKVENTYLKENIKQIAFMTSITMKATSDRTKSNQETISHLCEEAKLTKHAGTNYIQHGNILLQNYAGQHSL